MIAGCIALGIFLVVGAYCVFGLPIYGGAGSYWGDWR